MIAIDVLLEPDAATQERARRVNAALRTDHPAGFAFDATHLPHATLVQRYIDARDLDAVCDALAVVLAGRDVAGMRLEVTRVNVRIEDGSGSASWLIRPQPALQALADDCLAAVQPFARGDGTAAAFVPEDDGAPIRPSTVRYVECFAPEHSGANYVPHITLGRGSATYLQALGAEAFEPFAFSPSALAIHQLGNHGTARRRLWSWRGAS